MLLECIRASRIVSFCFSFSHVARYVPSWKTKVTTQVVVCWLGILFGAPRRGNLRIAQGRAKRRPGYYRPSPAFALQGQKRKNHRLLFVHTLHLLYYICFCPCRAKALPTVSSPRAPLRSALGYAQIAPAGRTDGIIPPIISTQPIHFFGQQRPE